MQVALAVAGAAGRMGRCVVALAAADTRFRLVAALDQRSSGLLGQDAGECAGISRCGVGISEHYDDAFDVMIDFSTPVATHGWLELCSRRHRPIVIGTTGHTADQSAAIETFAKRIAVLKSANMSVGVNVLLRLVEQLAAHLGDEYDAELIETHHRFKADAPSGTALALRDAIIRGRGTPADVVFGRHGLGSSRQIGQIGIHSVRAGDIVGEHEVRFSTMGETVIVRHAAHSRDTFARGALAAAAWIIGRPPGLYGMGDVLFNATD